MDRDPGPISLSGEHGRFVAREVELGHYDSPKAVVEQGLRLLREQEAFLRANRAAIREKLERAAKQVERGEFIDGDDFIAKINKLDRAAGRKKRGSPKPRRPKKRS